MIVSSQLGKRPPFLLDKLLVDVATPDEKAVPGNSGFAGKGGGISMPASAARSSQLMSVAIAVLLSFIAHHGTATICRLTRLSIRSRS